MANSLVNKISMFEKVHPLQVKLCGHAALAAAHTLFKSGLINSNIIDFLTSAGTLRAKKVTDPVKPADGKQKTPILLN